VSDVLLSQDIGGVRLLTLRRPESLNALNTELKLDLLAALRDTAADDQVRAVVITGAGNAFCAGQDLREHAESLNSADPTSTVTHHYNPLIRTLTTMPKPVIAAVNGTAAGAGAALAFACDLRVAAPEARFLLAFASVGLSTDSGTSWTLPRLIGYGRAMQMLLLAEPIEAEEALRIGMINRVAASGAVVEAATEWAQRMAIGPTSAYARIKEAMLASTAQGLDEALAVEAGTQAEAARTADHREAVSAFLAKRTPNFTGH
jgi:2-(1,2-epoxy-1,2-dihydrophenyl)acetyl-CoA isomerase